MTAEPLSRNESGRFGALKSDSTHLFFRNACTKSGSLRFSQFLTDFVCLYTYEFWLSLCKIARSSVILLLPLCTWYCIGCPDYDFNVSNILLVCINHCMADLTFYRWRLLLASSNLHVLGAVVEVFILMFDLVPIISLMLRVGFKPMAMCALRKTLWCLSATCSRSVIFRPILLNAKKRLQIPNR